MIQESSVENAELDQYKKAGDINISKYTLDFCISQCFLTISETFKLHPPPSPKKYLDNVVRSEPRSGTDKGNTIGNILRLYSFVFSFCFSFD